MDINSDSVHRAFSVNMSEVVMNLKHLYVKNSVLTYSVTI